MPIDKIVNHKLFEPTLETNFKVGNWSRYCKPHSMVTEKTNFCELWIGIKWNGKQFVHERSNKSIKWANFKDPDNFVHQDKTHQCR